MESSAARQLSVNEVRYTANLRARGIESSTEISPALNIVGQSEAMESLELGLKIKLPGYNVFLAGLKGTGRFAAIREMVSQTVPTCPLLKSYLYVHQFQEPESPLLVTLPPGHGKDFQKEIENLKEALRESIPALLNRDVLAKARQRLMSKYEKETRHLFGDFETHVSDAGFAFVQGSAGEGTVQVADIFPKHNGEPVPIEQFRAEPGDFGLDSAKLAEIERRREDLKVELNQLVVKHRHLGLRYKRLIRESEIREVGEALDQIFSDLRSRYGELDRAVDVFVDGLRDEILEHLESFREHERGTNPGSNAPRLEDLLTVVQVNLLFDPDRSKGGNIACPVIEESHPTWRNLFGGIDAAGEPPSATFLDIRAGSVLRANGGFLMLSARDVLNEPRVYDHLKRILRKGVLEIASREDGPSAHFGLKPTPIPLDLKVILVGEPPLYDVLHGMDPDFRKIFKIKVEFDDQMSMNDENIGKFLSVLRRIIDEGKLSPFSRSALELLVEEGVRLAGDRAHLTTQFSDLADLMREAWHLSDMRSSPTVDGVDISRAVTLRDQRVGLIERQFLERLRDGKLQVEVTGSRIGQINGLGFYDLDYAQFGMPARISATCAAGRAGVVNIEREAELSGSIHNKGVLILSGFLASTFAQDKPLSLQANIAFEQSYAPVDGDSASLAELIALLSALARIPIRQDLAVTGSLSQLGGVQPVGGVTEKTQGFFKACRIKGLTGTQGVILPASNVRDLHLSRETVAAMEAGQFRVHAVTDYRQALEILTERSASDVLLECDRTLRNYAEIVRRQD